MVYYPKKQQNAFLGTYEMAVTDTFHQNVGTNEWKSDGIDME